MSPMMLYPSAILPKSGGHFALDQTHLKEIVNGHHCHLIQSPYCRSPGPISPQDKHIYKYLATRCVINAAHLQSTHATRSTDLATSAFIFIFRYYIALRGFISCVATVIC